MSVAILFEVQATPDEPLHEILAEVDKLPHWERQMMIARVMRFRADQMAEEAAGGLALQAAEERRQARARATRERKKTQESAEPVHWAGEPGEGPTSLHGNGASSFARTSGDEDEVTCKLCLTLLARESGD